MDNKMVEFAADKLYTQFKTFERAISAAVDAKLSNPVNSAERVFWDLVIAKLRAARKSLSL